MTTGCLIYPHLYNSDQCYLCEKYLDCVRQNAPRYVTLKCPTCGNMAELVGDWAIHHYVVCPYCGSEMK